MKGKRNRIQFVIFMAAFVDGYRVVKEMADDFNRNGLFERSKGGLLLAFIFKCSTITGLTKLSKKAAVNKQPPFWGRISGITI